METTKPLTIEQAYNWLKDMPADFKSRAMKDLEKQPGVSFDQNSYLTYCLTFCESPELKAVLRLRLLGASHQEIAEKFECHTNLIIALELKAKDAIKKGIDKARRTGMPVFGGFKYSDKGIDLVQHK